MFIERQAAQREQRDQAQAQMRRLPAEHLDARVHALTQLQRTIGNRAVARLLCRGITPVTARTIQRAHWEWNGSKWTAVGNPSTPRPTYNGKTVGQRAGEEADAPIAAANEYDAAETLTDGTTVNWPALVVVMTDVTIGTAVAPGVWRKMRENLSNAIALPNKSHPAHGSNFNKKQRPEQQIADWATPMQGELKRKLAEFFSAKYNVAI